MSALRKLLSGTAGEPRRLTKVQVAAAWPPVDEFGQPLVPTVDSAPVEAPEVAEAPIEIQHVPKRPRTARGRHVLEYVAVEDIASDITAFFDLVPEAASLHVHLSALDGVARDAVVVGRGDDPEAVVGTALDWRATHCNELRHAMGYAKTDAHNFFLHSVSLSCSAECAAGEAPGRRPVKDLV